jgi:hypothetical protein
MPRSHFRRKIAALAVAAALVSTWSSAAEPSGHSAPGLMAQLWSFVTGIALDAGCRFDPDGQCATGAAVTPDAGCLPDPNGHCGTGTVVPNAGCMADPDGRCLSRS